VTDTYIWVQNGRGDCSIHVIAEGKQLAGCCLDDSFWTAEELNLQPGDVFGAVVSLPRRVRIPAQDVAQWPDPWLHRRDQPSEQERKGGSV
jgi:hypothetical protein